MTGGGLQPGTHSRAAILAIGDEITLGQTLNTNTRWLAEKLTAAGIVPVEHVTVPDDHLALSAAIARMAGSVDLVVATGGLGPTADDLTRPALAAAMGDNLVEDKLALAQIEAWFAATGREVSPLNRVQALRPSGAITLPNLYGTAPREMTAMYEAQVLPRLGPPPDRTVRTHVLHCVGIGESDLAAQLGDLMDRGRAPVLPLVGTTASGMIVSCRVRYEGSAPPLEAEALLEQVCKQIRQKAGEYVFGEQGQTLPGAVMTLLRERSETVATVESCTGGMLASMLTEVPGSSLAFTGGLVTYADELKQTLAGVDGALLGPGPEAPGAVSREVAVAMAVGGLGRLKVNHCLAITGIAGPGGAVPAVADRQAKPVGTVYIARVSRLTGNGHGTDVRKFLFAGDRQQVREWSCRTALAMLRLHLVGAEHLRLLRQVA
jgi:nicotinamide-nucleotide amidase